MGIPRVILLLNNTIFGIVEFFIGLRIILKLFGASTSAPFVSWVYETTNPLLRPFLGMFPSPRLEGGFIIEFSALFGLLVYAFIGYLIEQIILELIYQAGRRERNHKK